jgi:hypothetical protein
MPLACLIDVGTMMRDWPAVYVAVLASVPR